MGAEDNKATLRRIVEDFNKRDLSFVDEVYSPHFALYTALTPNWPRGLEGVRKAFTTMLNAAPDLHATIEDIFAEGDKVAVRWTFRGTHQEESLLGGALTGNPYTAVAISIYRFVDGKIEEDWGVDARWQTGEVWK